MTPSDYPDYRSISVVSGLPRSGTSLMMRMLQAAGFPILTDSIRRADQENPGGYYEFEPVKQLKRESDWLDMARGKAVKIIYRLLYHLPPHYDYRVIFMRRELQEVVQSQNKMLERSGKERNRDISDSQISEMFQAELGRCLKWIDQQPHVAVLQVDYNRLLRNPQPIAEEINQFLGQTLDIDAMIGVIDHDLYRNRLNIPN